MTSRHEHHPIPAPWVLVDDLTVDQTTDLLDGCHLALRGTNTDAAARCARALSLGETDDPITLATWADALAARLRHQADHAQLDPSRLTD